MIYFAQPVDGGPIKIGHSVNVDARRKQLERHYGRPLVVLRMLEGGLEKEAEMHARFEHYRLGIYEQFLPGPELMAFLGLPAVEPTVYDSIVAMKPTNFDPNRPDDVSTKFDRSLLGMARMVATAKGVSLAEYLSEAARPIIERDYGKEMKRLVGGDQ